MKLLLAAVCALTAAACAPAAPAPVAPAQTQTTRVGPHIYEGTYALQAPNRVIDLRVWVDEQGQLNGELVGLGQQTVFRPSSTEHRFLHATSDNLSFVFTVENGRATAATMTQRDRRSAARASRDPVPGPARKRNGPVSAPPPLARARTSPKHRGRLETRRRHTAATAGREPDGTGGVPAVQGRAAAAGEGTASEIF